MEVTTYYWIGGGIVVAIILLRFFLNRPSKAKQEHLKRMEQLKKKSQKKGTYNELRPLPQDKKKH